MFIQSGCTPLQLLLLRSALSADEKLLLMKPLLGAGAAINQTVTDGPLVRICMFKKFFT